MTLNIGSVGNGGVASRVSIGIGDMDEVELIEAHVRTPGTAAIDGVAESPLSDAIEPAVFFVECARSSRRDRIKAHNYGSRQAGASEATQKLPADLDASVVLDQVAIMWVRTIVKLVATPTAKPNRSHHPRL